MLNLEMQKLIGELVNVCISSSTKEKSFKVDFSLNIEPYFVVYHHSDEYKNGCCLVNDLACPDLEFGENCITESTVKRVIAKVLEMSK